ncbi:MAG: sugar phosphate nucleotidyltransferase [Spirochaetota bacterium]
MKVIIPAAGMGSRLRPHTITKPKPLLPVAGARMIDLIMAEILTLPNVDEVIFIIGHLGDMIRDYIARTYPSLKTSFVIQAESQGLGHAISLTRDHVRKDDEILIILSDTIFKGDLASVIAKKINSLGVYEVDDPSRFGVAVMDGERVKALIEKPSEPVSRLALVGIYYLVKASPLFTKLDYIITNNIRTKNEFQLTDALGKMVEAGEQFTVFPISQWFDCGTKNATLDTNRMLIENRIGNAHVRNATIVPPVVIEDGAVIERSVVGPYVYVCRNAVIRESVIDNAIIDEGATVSEAVLTRSIISAHGECRRLKESVNLSEYSSG